DRGKRGSLLQPRISERSFSSRFTTSSRGSITSSTIARSGTCAAAITNTRSRRAERYSSGATRGRPSQPSAGRGGSLRRMPLARGRIRRDGKVPRPMGVHPASESEPSGFDDLFGLELADCSEELARGQVRVRDELRQIGGVVHGGVYCAMAE